MVLLDLTKASQIWEDGDKICGKECELGCQLPGNDAGELGEWWGEQLTFVFPSRNGGVEVTVYSHRGDGGSKQTRHSAKGRANGHTNVGHDESPG